MQGGGVSATIGPSAAAVAPTRPVGQAAAEAERASARGTEAPISNSDQVPCQPDSLRGAIESEARGADSVADGPNSVDPGVSSVAATGSPSNAMAPSAEYTCPDVRSDSYAALKAC